MDIKKEITQLLACLAIIRKRELLLTQASQLEFDEYEKKYKIFSPEELRGWLKICNGTLVVGGGLFGINKEDKFLEIANHYKYKDYWKELGWIPISSDGCGDYYVLDTHTQIKNNHPVYFLDQMDYAKPNYVVSSGLWKFLRFRLIEEIEFHEKTSDMYKTCYWPFEKEKVIAEDPDILLCKTAPLPWEADNNNDNEDDDHKDKHPPSDFPNVENKTCNV